MKRRTLDLAFSVGGLALAALLLVMGLVLTSNANFANDYVRDQLSEQKIAFKAETALTDEERQSECVVANAGQQLTTGKQAECYANEFIAVHLEGTADGLTYAELGAPQTELRNKVKAAQESGDPNLATLQDELDEITQQRETMFKGETLRGVLLTSYGFSEFGTKAEQVATVLYVAAALMLLLSIAGFVHALRTDGTDTVGEPEHPAT